MNNNYKNLIEQFPSIEQGKMLAPFTSFGIGGPADLFYNLSNPVEIEAIEKTAKKLNIPVFILGGGSNTIFADEGFRGLVIHVVAKNISMKVSTPLEANEGVIVAEAGALLSQVIQFAQKNNLIGIEKLMGLPGTIGGAVRGNAGAFGVEMKDVVEKVLLYNPERGIVEADKNVLEFDYRTSKIKHTNDTILKVYLKLHKADEKATAAARAAATDIVKNRITKQPKGKCSGSFFKNPGGGPNSPTGHDLTLKAGHLLEQVGAKGMQVGGVKVSDHHANWLMNTGTGTQKEVLELSNILRQEVKKRFHIALEREVQLVSATGVLIS